MPNKILIVEDSPSAAALLKTFLLRYGFEVLVAADAMIGVKELIRSKPDLVLLDLMLPAGGGAAVLRSLRSSMITTSTPVLVLTGSNDPAVRKQVLEFGVSAFLKKPYEPADLLALACQQLGIPIPDEVAPNSTPANP